MQNGTYCADKPMQLDEKSDQMQNKPASTPMGQVRKTV